jgi:hypothetical protein
MVVKDGGGSVRELDVADSNRPHHDMVGCGGDERARGREVARGK